MCQIRCTELTLIPTCLAIIWAVQWVTSPGGSVCVSATVCSCTVAGSRGIRDGRVLSHSSPSTPCAMKRSCQRHTVTLLLPVCRMIVVVPTPSAVISTMRARHTCFCGLLRSATIAAKRTRSPALTWTVIPWPMLSPHHPAEHTLCGLFSQILSTTEASIGLASVLSTKLADGWSPVLQEDIPRAEHLLLAVINNRGVSNRAAAHFTLGVLRQMQIRLPEAQREFEKAVSLDPNNARTYLHLGETSLYLGQPEAGIPPLEQAIRLRPDDPNLAITYWVLGTCQLLLGRVDQAIDLLQTARAAKSRWWVPYFYLAGAYGLKSDLDRARSALGESLRLKPALRSVARMRAENPWLSNPQYWALQEKTLNLGLRQVGFPDQ